MTRFWIRKAIWSSLHELVWISESSHGSIFESPFYWIHNGHNLNLLLSSSNCTSKLISLQFYSYIAFLYRFMIKITLRTRVLVSFVGNQEFKGIGVIRA